MQKNFRFAIAAMIAFALNACNKGVDINQLPGVYASNFEDYSDTIFLNSNHTYMYKQLYKNSFRVKKGVWTLKNEMIIFENFSFQNSANSPVGDWEAEVKKVNNEIRIIYADEEGYYYKKIR